MATKQASDNVSGRRFFIVSENNTVVAKKLAVTPEEAVTKVVATRHASAADSLRRATGTLHGSGHFTIGRGCDEILLFVS